MNIFKFFAPQNQSNKVVHASVPSTNFSSPSPVSYSRLTERWPLEYFETDAFYLRLHRALYDLPNYSFSIVGGNSMRIYSENQHRTYFCTFRQCDCEDFRKKSLPCKHMIFLDIQINGRDSIFQHALGFSAHDLNYIQSSGRCVWEIVERLDNEKPVLSVRTPGFDRLIRSGYLTESFHDDLLLSKFTRAELAALIRISGQNPAGAKSKLIPWILSNSTAIIKYCRLKYVFWDIPEQYNRVFHFLSRYSAINNCFPRRE